MIGKTIDELKIGDAAEFGKTVTESDIYLYAGVTGDFNPAHLNEEYAKKTFFKTRIAQGMLTAGFRVYSGLVYQDRAQYISGRSWIFWPPYISVIPLRPGLKSLRLWTIKTG